MEHGNSYSFQLMQLPSPGLGFVANEGVGWAPWAPWALIQRGSVVGKENLFVKSLN